MAWTATSPGSPTTLRNGRRRVAALLAAALGLGAAGVAVAVDPVPVPGVPGITAPAGLARDANGDLWVADSGGGICRLVDPPFPPLSGMECPPNELQGPKSPGQMALDPASGLIFVGDLASAGGAVWRLHLDQGSAPGQVDSATLLVDLPAERVLGMAYDAATDTLYYTLKDTEVVQTLPDASSCLAPCSPVAGGSALAKAAPSLALDSDGRLYLADSGGISRLADPAAAGTTAEAIPGFANGTYISLAFDPAADGDGRVYAGTNNAVGSDWIDVLRVADDAVATPYSEGFDAVTAIGIDTRTGTQRPLDVVDDQSAKQFGEDTVGGGRRLTVPFERFDRPTIVSGPPAIGNSRSVTFAYTAPSPTTFWCSLDGAPAAPCGAGASSQITFDAVADGVHEFEVQSDNPANGGRASRQFEVDTHAPRVTFGNVAVGGATAHVGFMADDVTATFLCALDGAAASPCESPATYTGLALGLHTVSVSARDAAGNASDAATSFTIAPPVVTPAPVTVGPPTPWKPRPISATLTRRTLRVVFTAPPGATRARFTITRRSGAPIRTRVIRISGGTRNVVRIVLPLGAAARLQAARATVTITAGASTAKLTTPAGRGTLRILARLPRTGAR